MVIAHQLIDTVFVRDLDVDDAAGLHHRAERTDHGGGIENVLEHILADDYIELAQFCFDARFANVALEIGNFEAKFAEPLLAHACALSVDFDPGDGCALLSHGNEHAAVSGADIEHALAAQWRNLTNHSNDLAATLNFTPGIGAPDFRVVASGVFRRGEALLKRRREIAAIRAALRETLLDAKALVGGTIFQQFVVLGSSKVVHACAAERFREKKACIAIMWKATAESLSALNQSGGGVAPFTKSVGELPGRGCGIKRCSGNGICKSHRELRSRMEQGFVLARIRADFLWRVMQIDRRKREIAIIVPIKGRLEPE